MKTKSSAVSFSLLAILIFSAANALAVTVDFTDMDRGPSETLQIDGVTISKGTYFDPDVGSMPATASGIGLGSGTIGSLGTVDRIQDITGYMRESLSLKVSGSINSVSITPYFSVVGSKEDIFLPFDLSYVIGPLTTGGPTYVTLSDSSPFVLNLSFVGPYDRLQIGLQSDFGNPAVQIYLSQHPDATVQFGFTITSLNYTPDGVPETSTVMLFAIGLVSIAWLRRKIIA
jgi:hypothetical protein